MKKIQILGTGCPKCKQLALLAAQAAEEMQIDYELEKITQIDEIMSFGVMLTPALVVDGVVKISGKLPSLEQLKEMLK